jgi:acetyl-CoA carboxylase, biotin carboxylase subunit
MFSRILVANRGEIALRVVRAARELGVGTVAVYSDADRLAPHVQAADTAVRIGAPPSADSYLRGDVLIDAARRTGCEAVHPGYGFLSERAGFARAVEEAGLVFIGPPAEAIAAMGDKAEARRRMTAAGVPVVPGSPEPLADPAAALAAAEEVGYPVLLKAAAGGGGKGMRVVQQPAELARAFDAAAREAEASFADGRLYLERYLTAPRHIEIQVLADAHGHVLHLGERECSIQRRHQKMIEESPSSVITPELRATMGAAAVTAAAAVGYRNAGTIEFLYENGAFFFIEMNTRIQVEHPVTELVTGLDLVQWQIRIAAGERLPLRQDEVRFRGHAIECRITSESATHGFMPSTGRIRSLELPGGPGVRWDGGIAEGYEVSLYYDPLLGKLVTWGEDRATAIARMRRALAELRILGIDTSIPFHRLVLTEADFLAGNTDIRYLERHPEVMQPRPDAERLRLAAAAAALLEEEVRRRRGVRQAAQDAPAGASRWRDRGWR